MDFSRQKDIVPEDKLSKCTIIGVGATGRQVALLLTSIGVPELQLIDFDIVDESNIVTQGFYEEDVGAYKVDATSYHCAKINVNVVLETLIDKYKRSMDVAENIFCCVDGIQTRSHIWDCLKNSTFFIDSRVSAETVRILPVYNEETFEYYPTTLFPPEEAYVGPCTAKMTIYCANIAASLMVAQYTKFLRGMELDRDIVLNLLSSEMIVQ